MFGSVDVEVDEEADVSGRGGSSEATMAPGGTVRFCFPLFSLSLFLSLLEG